jgi:ADP-L-glycero-D-manno-heptose 6-epimerase
MSILITGAAGFIGSNLVARLEDEWIFLVDSFGTSDKWNNVRNRKSPFAEIIDPNQLESWLEREEHIPDIIVHLGAVTDTGATDADFVVENNLRFSKRLLNWATERDIPFIYASSAAVYGHGPCDDENIHEELKPLNLYAWSKLEFDKSIPYLTDPSFLVGLRFFNVYGPNEYHKGSMSSIIYQYFCKRDLALFDQFDGKEPERDFIYVDDVIDVLLFFIKKAVEKEKLQGIFNVGTGEATTFLDMCTLAARVMDLHPNFDRKPFPESLLPSYQFSTQATTKKLRAAGYEKPFTPPSVGVRKYFEKLMSNDPYV